MATSAEPDAEIAADLSRLRTFVVADFLAAVAGVAFILVVWRPEVFAPIEQLQQRREPSI